MSFKKRRILSFTKIPGGRRSTATGAGESQPIQPRRPSVDVTTSGGSAADVLDQSVPNGREYAKWVMRDPEMKNTMGLMYQAIFTTIVMMILAPFRCYDHPEVAPGVAKKASLVSHPDVICGGDDHTVMV